MKEGIEEVVIILSFLGRLRKEDWTCGVVGIIAKVVGIESLQHSHKSLIIIVVITKIEEGSTSSSCSKIWHAMIDVGSLKVSGDTSRAGIIVAATCHTTFLLRRLTWLVLVVWVGLEVLLFEGSGSVFEVSFGLLICQLPLLS